MTSSGFPSYGGRGNMVFDVNPDTGTSTTVLTFDGKEDRALAIVTPKRNAEHRPEQMQKLQVLADQAINWTDAQWAEFNAQQGQGHPVHAQEAI